MSVEMIELLGVRIRTVDGLDAELNEEHWQLHVVEHHPELADKLDMVVETLQRPDGVFRSKRDGKTRVYMRTYESVQIGDRVIERIPLLVLLREPSGFVVTAHFDTAQWRVFEERLWPL